MNACEILLANFRKSTPDSDEFQRAYDYLTKGLSFQEEETVFDYLTAAFYAEHKRAFIAGVKAAVSLLTGGYSND